MAKASEWNRTTSTVGPVRPDADLRAATAESERRFPAQGERPAGRALRLELHRAVTAA